MIHIEIKKLIKFTTKKDSTDKLTRPFFRILGTNYKNYQIQYSCTYNDGKYLGSKYLTIIALYKIN